MPLDLSGPAVKEQLEQLGKEKGTEVSVTATPDAGGTVRAEVASEGSYWSASAWYQWAKDKGKSYGAKVGLRF